MSNKPCPLCGQVNYTQRNSCENLGIDTPPKIAENHAASTEASLENMTYEWQVRRLYIGSVFVIAAVNACAWLLWYVVFTTDMALQWAAVIVVLATFQVYLLRWLKRIVQKQTMLTFLTTVHHSSRDAVKQAITEIATGTK